MKSFTIRGLVFVAILSLSVAVPIAHAPSGAIFTTVADGTEVNFNIYPSKEAVYLDGGPGPGAPIHAAGLDDDTYVFQVTDPSGKTLLSTDKAKCRQFVVLNGVINIVNPSVTAGCAHVTGFDVDHSATTVQLMPYKDTPNPGGVYKVWVVRVDDFIAGCQALATAKRKPVPNNGLESVDCGYNAGNAHGFVPAHSKTDNFKVKNQIPREIDTKFCRDLDQSGTCELWNGEEWIDGLGITWSDTLSASNQKWSYLDAELQVNHEAHVENVENGTHRITIPSQPECTVNGIEVLGRFFDGPATVDVAISRQFSGTVFIYVACAVS